MNFDRNQFIWAIVANIATAIIIWLYKRGTLGAKNLFTKGTIRIKVRQIFSAKRVGILGSLAATIFNLWILVKFIVGRSVFTRFELFAAMMLSLIVVYWTNRLVADLRFTTERKLEEARQTLEEAQQRGSEIERQLEETKKRQDESEKRSWL
jgi:hypothetical protein